MSYSTSLDDLLGPDESNMQPPQTLNNQPGMNIQPQSTLNNQPVNNNQMVDAILTELDNIPEFSSNGNNGNAAAVANMMDGNVHIPPPQLDNTANLLKAESVHKPSIDNVLNNAAFAKKSKQPFHKRYRKELILASIFMALMFIFSLHQVNRILFGFFPKLLLENGQISILGIALKTILTTVLFSLALFLI